MFDESLCFDESIYSDESVCTDASDCSDASVSTAASVPGGLAHEPSKCRELRTVVISHEARIANNTIEV